MNRIIEITLIITLVMMLVAGCSGNDGSPVYVPVDEGIIPELTADTTQSAASSTLLWGYYDMYFDFDAGTVEFVPNRAMMFTVNIVAFLNNNPAGVTASNFSTSSGTGFIQINMDITITHPIDNEKYNGYDVRGIFVGNGSETLNYNADLKVPVYGTDQWLVNADGYSRWFNPVEFTTPGMFGYKPGILAPLAYTGTATVNGYKYFGEGLDPYQTLDTYLNSGEPDSGYFLHGTSNTMRYEIKFPTPAPGVKYGYAITANWAGGAPQFHPSHAVEALAGNFGIVSNAWYTNENDNGGWVIAYLTIFDWFSELTGGVMEDYNIIVDSDMFSAPYVLSDEDMKPVVSSGKLHTYLVSIPANNLTYSGHHPVWILVEYPGYDYSNPFGVPNAAGSDPLASAFYFEYWVGASPVEPEITVSLPNGGETWVAGSIEVIQWFSLYLPGNVNIYYYKDGNPSNPTVIANNVPNIHVYYWTIPFDASNTVRVGIESVLLPTIYDVSDSDFSIVVPSIQVTAPNGGEKWEIGHDYEITWTSEYLSGNVNILYSKDNFVSDNYVIVNNIPDSGGYTWTIPNDPSNSVKVKVESAVNSAIFDVSNNSFTIKQPVEGWAYLYNNLNDSWGYAVALDGSGYAYAAITSEGVAPNVLTGMLAKFNEDGGHWIKTWRGATASDNSEALDIAINDNNDIFIAGRYRGTVDFNPDEIWTENRTSNGGWDAYILKLDTDGEFQSVIVWGGPGDETARGIDIDSMWDIYVTGYFGSTVDFDPGSGTHNETSIGAEDIYLCKFTSGGNLSWVEAWGSGGNDRGHDVCIQGYSAVIVTGQYEQTVDFEPGAPVDSHTSNGLADIFLTYYEQDGTYGWTRTWGGADIDCGLGLEADSGSYIYVCGYFADYDVDFDPDPTGTDVKNALSNDAFVCRYDTSGDYLYGLTWGGGAFEEANDVCLSTDNHLYVTGIAEGGSGLTDLDPDVSTDLHDADGAFLSRFETTGIYVWGRTWGSGLSGTETAGHGLCKGEEGSVYVTGAFDGTDVNFAPDDVCGGSAFPMSSIGGLDMFITKYRSDGCW